jgi:hypothetical protein
MERIEVRTEVTEAVALGEQLRTVATVVLPDELADPPVICFAFPGGGYSRGYFTFDMPGSSGGGQAGWHARRGWVFVACDHLSVGDSDTPADPFQLTIEHLALANKATVEHVLGQLRRGALSSLPGIERAAVLGIGQSMGGCLTIVQQGQHASYDGIGVLGYSAIHTVLAMPPGTPPAPPPGVPRGTRLDTAAVARNMDLGGFTGPAGTAEPAEADLPATTWGFHYDDEPRDVVLRDMVDYPGRRGQRQPWAALTIPPCSGQMVSAGAVSHEASLIASPVLVAVGERDVCPDPKMEPKAYERSSDVTVYVCPRMSHMHNFAGTREQFWTRIHSWGQGVATARASGRTEALAGAR